jgi:transposase
MSRYDLTDFEWRVIEPLLPNKPRGVPRVDDRRVLNGHLLGATIRRALARSPRGLWPAHHLLQPLRAMAEGRCVEQADGCHCRCSRWRHSDDRQHLRSRPPAGRDDKKGDADHCLGRSRGATTSSPPTSLPWFNSPQCGCGCALMSLRPREFAE